MTAVMRPLNILHIFRAPVGGLFRHVLDLARGQIARGHKVGLIADSGTGGARAEEILAKLAPQLALGLTRVPMPRLIGPQDLLAALHVARRTRQTEANIAHGHGAKGGAYVRLAGSRAIRAYTPHGGSLHYSRDTLSGKIYLATESLLMPRGDLYLFESAYSAGLFRAKIGESAGIMRVVHNGVGAAEFEPVKLAPDATDLLFLGEFRMLKGIDILVEAIALLKRQGRHVTATFVGDGPDGAALHALAARKNLQTEMRFLPPMPARHAMAHGRIMVVPSRAESLPYVVLETAAAAKPMIATCVGGIPEIYGPLADMLVPPADAPTLAAAIGRTLDSQDGGAELARSLRTRVREGFSVDSMVDGILDAYQAAIAAR